MNGCDLVMITAYVWIFPHFDRHTRTVPHLVIESHTGHGLSLWLNWEGGVPPSQFNQRDVVERLRRSTTSLWLKKVRKRKRRRRASPSSSLSLSEPFVLYNTTLAWGDVPYRHMPPA